MIKLLIIIMLLLPAVAPLTVLWLQKPVQRFLRRANAVRLRMHGGKAMSENKPHEASVYEKFGEACRPVPYKVNEQDVLDALQSVANKFGVEVTPNWQQTMLEEHRRIQRTRVSYVQQKWRSKKIPGGAPMITRRGLLQGILAAGLAPAIVKAEILMPVRKIIVPSWGIGIAKQMRPYQLVLNEWGRDDVYDAAAWSDKKVIILHPGQTLHFSQVHDYETFNTHQLEGPQ